MCIRAGTENRGIRIALIVVTYQQINTMRTTWLILLLMLALGAGMYLFATRKKPLASNDMITIENTPDSIRKKLKLFVAYTPAQITYADSTWLVQDSVPLKEINLDSATTAFDMNYTSATFYLDYDHKLFYDVEVNKADAHIPYAINFAVKPEGNVLVMHSSINNPRGNELRISGPMVKMYRTFLLTYNGRMPPETDTSATDTSIASSIDTSGIQPTKTIKVITQ
jgi:hypothetical protein